MFTKLMFNIDGEEITLHSHEVVKMVMDIVSDDTGISPGTIFEPHTNNKYLTMMQDFSSIGFHESGTFDSFIFMPAHIQGMKSLRNWLFIAKERSTKKAKKDDIKGLWFIVASRLIHLDLYDMFWYVSDHGALSDVVHDAKKIAVGWNWLANPTIIEGMIKAKVVYDRYNILLRFPEGKINDGDLYVYLENQDAENEKMKYQVTIDSEKIVTAELSSEKITKKNYDSIKKKIKKDASLMLKTLTVEEKSSVLAETHRQGNTRSLEEVEKQYEIFIENYRSLIISASSIDIKRNFNYGQSEFLETQKKFREESLDSDYIQMYFKNSYELVKYIASTLKDKLDELVSRSDKNDDTVMFQHLYKEFVEEIEKQKEREKSREESIVKDGLYVVYKGDKKSDKLIKEWDLYLKYFILAELTKDINLGRREALYRPESSYGKREAGDAYHNFAATVKSYFARQDAISQRELAAIMRSIISGSDLKDDQLSFLPNLTVAWLIAEGARNHSTILTTIMLIDLIEKGVSLESNEFNLYEWLYTLVHPYNDKTTEKIYDLYGDEVSDSSNATGPQRMGGSHPMAHDGSAGHGRDLNEKVKLNIARQKEGSLILHWLHKHISSSHPELIRQSVSFSLEDQSSWAVQKPVYTEINDNFEKIDKDIEKIRGTIRKKKKDVPLCNVDKQENEIQNLQKQRKKLKLIHYLIKPLLKLRLESTENFLLYPAESIEPIIKEFLSIHSTSGSDNYISKHESSVVKSYSSFFEKHISHIINSENSRNFYKKHYGHNEFLVALQSLGITQQYVLGDGACQFRSVHEALKFLDVSSKEADSGQFSLDDAAVNNLRRAVVKHINIPTNHERFTDALANDTQGGLNHQDIAYTSLKDYLIDMLKPTTYGDRLTLQALSEIISRPVIVIRPTVDLGCLKSPENSLSCSPENGPGLTGADQVDNTTQGYVRDSVLADGNCGYTALGITREQVVNLLLENIGNPDVIALLRLPIGQALLTKSFYNYLIESRVIEDDITHQGITDHIEAYITWRAVQEVYIRYDVRDTQIDAGYAHPRVLQAIAHIQNLELHIWRLDENEVLIPHVVGEENYAVYIPPQIARRVDLLYINGNHFELLDLSSYADNIPNEGICPLNSSWNRENLRSKSWGRSSAGFRQPTVDPSKPVGINIVCPIENTYFNVDNALILIFNGINHYDVSSTRGNEDFRHIVYAALPVQVHTSITSIQTLFRGHRARKELYILRECAAKK